MTLDDAIKIMKAARGVVSVKVYFELAKILENSLED